MIHKEIINKVTGEKLIIFDGEDFEYEKPTKHYGDDFIVKQMVLHGVPHEELNGSKEPSAKSKEIFIAAVKRWQDMFRDFKKVEVSENLIKLLSSTKKREQEALLKGIILSPNILIAFLIKSEDAGYTLSQYKSSFSDKSADPNKFPFAYEVKEDGGVKTFGETELSAGQLRHAIEHRKVKIAKFLDKDDTWHCFFTSFKSLRGEERWLGEKQPHYHYISNLFGIDRAEVVNQIKSEKYKLGNLPHIKLEDYGNQPE